VQQREGFGPILGLLTPHLFLAVLTAGVASAALWEDSFGFVHDWRTLGRRNFTCTTSPPPATRCW